MKNVNKKDIFPSNYPKTTILKAMAFCMIISCMLFSCQEELTISSDIATDYLLTGDLDVYVDHQEIFRYKGKPGVEVIPIGNNVADFNDCFVLYVASRSESEGNVSSAIINLDGQEVLNTSDFFKEYVLFEFEICNLTPTSQLEVEIRGEPGSYLDIWMEGKLKRCTFRFTVNSSGVIQTDDLWTTGSTQYNEWAKPIYRIWIDTNGNPEDGPYGNGSGKKQAEVWLDTGNLYFEWYGPDGVKGTVDDDQHYNIIQISNVAQEVDGIRALLTDNNTTFEVTIPLSLIGNPSSMDVGFMASPWTTTASDNLGPGNSGYGYWMTVDPIAAGTYSADDATGDNSWPGLSPDQRLNFDLVKAEVIIN